MFLVLFMISCVLLFYILFVQPLRYWQNKNVQGGTPMWIFGDFWETFLLSKSYNDVLMPLYRKYSRERYFGLYQYNEPILVLRDPELVKDVGVKYFRHFEDHRVQVPAYADGVWGKVLFELKGEQWRRMRSVMSPAFTVSKLKSMFPIMEEYAEKFVSFYLRKNQSVVEIDLKDSFTRYGNDLILNTTFGADINSLEDPDNDFYQHGKVITNFNGLYTIFKLMSFIVAPKICKALGMKILETDTVEFYKKVIRDTMKTREEKGLKRRDMFHMFMNARRNGNNVKQENGAVANDSSFKKKINPDIKIDDMAANIMAAIFSGFDSNANFLSFASYELAANPEVQEKLRNEVRRTLRECNGKLTYKILHRMEYLNGVVSETMRKWPIDLIIDRTCTKPYTIEPRSPGEEPLHIETGTTIWLPVYAIQRDAKNHPDPDRFNPERFLGQNKAKFNQNAFLPFGIGPRICIGFKYAIIQCKTLIFHIVKNFEIVPISKSQIPLKMKRAGFQVEIDGGFWFGLKRLEE